MTDKLWSENPFQWNLISTNLLWYRVENQKRRPEVRH